MLFQIIQGLSSRRISIPDKYSPKCVRIPPKNEFVTCTFSVKYSARQRAGTASKWLEYYCQKNRMPGGDALTAAGNVCPTLPANKGRMAAAKR